MTSRESVELAFYTAVDEAAKLGRQTPCRLDARYDSNWLRAKAAAELARLCRSACPVLQECRRLAAVRPAWDKEGTVLGGEYYGARSSSPHWLLLYDHLRQRIASGEFDLGDTLPDISKLQNEAGSRIDVVRSALAQLERAGLISLDRATGRAVVTSTLSAPPPVTAESDGAPHAIVA
ncbi:GntR family transcriptional regulator [Kribbella sp. NBC_00359]|uniref:GntR family transcriptional regulator n=1 Tax=Kribbella sp. NBC_00359 TaxID=2975966 RepID=UPI002E232DC0